MTEETEVDEMALPLRAGVNRAKLGKTNKRKGSNAERQYMQIFRDELGYPYCKTSRLASKLLDDAGVDLAFLPFNVQIKAGYAKGLNYANELTYIKNKLSGLFPDFAPEQNYPRVIIHRKDLPTGRRTRVDEDELVCMTFKDFCRIINQIQK